MGLKDFSDRNIRSEFFKRLDLAEAGSWASRIAMRVGSDREIETYRWLGASPAMREWIGGRQEGALRDEVYTITNRPFEATLSIDENDLRRDKTGQILARIGELATRAASHWESLLSTLIINTAGALCYDGQLFFDTDHVSGSSGTLTNLLGATEVPASNVTTATAPTVSELSNVILQTIAHMYTFKDDIGEPLNQNAKSFVAYVPTSFMASAIGAISTPFLASGANNPLIASGFQLSWIVDPRLTWTDSLAVFRADGMPLIMQDEVPVRFRTKDELFANHRVLYGVDASRNAGFGMWQHAAKVVLT